MNKLNDNGNGNGDVSRVSDDGFGSSNPEDDREQDAAILRDKPRLAELRCLTAASRYAENTSSLEVMRPSQTTCPDGGHDIDIVGKRDEVILFLGLMTGKTAAELDYVRPDEQDGKLKVRLDVKSGATIAGDVIDTHVVHTNRSPDYQAHVLVCTHPNPQITKDALRKLHEHEGSFKEDGKFFGIAPLAGLERIERVNDSLTPNRLDEKK